MSRNPTFTQAQVRRAVKGAEGAGLRVRRVTFNPDGSITVDTGDERFVPVDAPKSSLAGSWDDL